MTEDQLNEEFIQKLEAMPKEELIASLDASIEKLQGEILEELYLENDFEGICEFLDMGDFQDHEEHYEVSYNGKSVEVAVNRIEWMALDTLTASQTPDFDGMFNYAAELGAELLEADEEEVTVKEL